MGVDPSYKPLYEHVRDLQNKVHDAIDDQHHPLAQQVRQEMQHLVDDIEVHKNPRDLEDRIKRLAEAMHEARSHEHSFMDSHHADYYQHVFEHLREEVRHFSNY